MISHLQFYITNVCNLECRSCRSFNNLDFTGHHEFDFDVYREWADLLDLKSLVILGGEPLLHPRLDQWVRGLRQLWPRAWAKIDSNGTYISKYRGLHDLLVDNRYFLCINLHHPQDLERFTQEIQQVFGDCERTNHDDDRIRYNDLSYDKGGHYIWGGPWYITKKGLPIHLRRAWNFERTIVDTLDWQGLRDTKIPQDAIYVGDARKSYDACANRMCHHMVNGEIHKCGTMAAMPLYLKQKNLEWPDPLLAQYTPITTKNLDSEWAKVLISGPIPQCKFCPTTDPRFAIYQDTTTQ